MKRVLVMLIALAGCLGGEHRDARDTYNRGVAALGSGDLDGAEKLLLEARSSAGVDPDLRFRAAFDLGAAYAAQAEKLRAGQDEDLAKALDDEQNAVSWFSDALRQQPGDADATANLATCRARAQSIADDLRKGEGKLDARLDAVIDEQRGVLDAARTAWLDIQAAGGADPLAQQGTLTSLADRERGIVAEAGVIGDLASDEIDVIGKKKEEERTPDEKARVVQLKNLDLYLLDARTEIAEARRKLQDLAAEDGTERAEAAVVALKRAREQLLDPIAVMQRIAQDEVDLAKQTELGKPGALGSNAPDVAWLKSAAIAARQAGVHDRLEEVRARLQAALDAPAPKPEDDKDGKQAKLLGKVKQAMPHVTSASSAMETARVAMDGAKHDDALAAERQALDELARAIEVFSDLRQLVELAYAHGQQTLALLGPEAAKELPAAERGRQTREEVSGNIARLARIKDLIAEQAADAGAGSGSAADEAKQLMAQAEELRGEAAVALDAVQLALDKNADPTPEAKDADAKLLELRKLFFSVIDHLKELIREQGETRDETSTASGQTEADRAPVLPEILGKQSGHTAMAKAIVDALARQADEAAKKPAGPPQPGQPGAKTLSQAADEVRAGAGDMTDAEGGITAAKDAQGKSVGLQPVLTSQGKALDHLAAALKLLEPPKQKKNDKDNKDQQQQQQKQKQQQPQQQPQGGAGQRARDEDAKRQRERARRGSGSEPVDKDW